MVVMKIKLKRMIEESLRASEKKICLMCEIKALLALHEKHFFSMEPCDQIHCKALYLWEKKKCF